MFRQLPPNIQSLLLNELLKQVGHELGYQYINGKYEDGSDDSLLLDGILTQAAKDADVVKVKTVGTTMLQRLKELQHLDSSDYAQQSEPAHSDECGRLRHITMTN